MAQEQRPPSMQELFGEEEEDDFSAEEEEFDEEGEEEEDGEEESEEDEEDTHKTNHSTHSPPSDSDKHKDFNYTQDRLDAARQKLKAMYGQLKEQKAERKIVELEGAPIKRKRTMARHSSAPSIPVTTKLNTPPSSSLGISLKSQTSPPAPKVPFKISPTVARSPSAIQKASAKTAPSTRDRIMKVLKKKPGHSKVKSGMRVHKQ